MVAIFAGVRGFLDNIAVGDITRFEQTLLSDIRGKHADILETIRTEKEISKDTEEKLRAILEKFAKSFA